MATPRYDRTLTSGEAKALIGPMFGLSLEDDFELVIFVHSPSSDSGSAWTTAGDGWAIVDRARRALAE